MEPLSNNKWNEVRYDALKKEIEDLKFNISRSRLDNRESFHLKLGNFKAQALTLLDSEVGDEEIQKVARLLHKIDKASKIINKNQKIQNARQTLNPITRRNNLDEVSFREEPVLNSLKQFFIGLEELSPFEFDIVDNLLKHLIDHPKYSKVVDILVSHKEKQIERLKGYIGFLKVTRIDWESYSKEKVQAIFNLVKSCNPDKLKPYLSCEDYTMLEQFESRRRAFFFSSGGFSNKAEFHLQLEYLKKLKNYLPTAKSDPIVIIGAGPAGLMRGLLAALHNIPFVIIEKRPETKGRSRDNIINFGTMIQEIQLLEMFGIFSLADGNGQMVIKQAKKEISLDDLESCLKLVLNELQPNSILYERSMTSLEVSEDSLKVQIGERQITPSMVIDCSGTNSPFLEAVGVQKQKLSKPTDAIIAFFEDEDCDDKIKYEKKVIKEASQQRLAMIPQNLKRLGIMLRNKVDYLGSSLSPAELSFLRNRIKFLESSKFLPDNEKCKNGISANVKFMQEWVENEMTPLRENIDLILTSQAPGSYKPIYRKFRSGNIIHLPLYKAESPYALISGVPVIFAGDAQQTVDPSIGKGASKAMATAYSDLFLMNFVGGVKFNSSQMVLWKAKIDSSGTELNVESFSNRIQYGFPNNAFPTYYLDLAIEYGLIGWETRDQIIDLTEEIRKNIQEGLSNSFDKLIVLRKTIIEEFIKKNTSELTNMDLIEKLNALISSDMNFSKKLPHYSKNGWIREHHIERNRRFNLFIDLMLNLDEYLDLWRQNNPGLSFCRQS